MSTPCGCRFDVDHGIIYCPLHAAAPRLLAGCKMAIPLVEWKGSPPPVIHWFATLTKLRTAIAAAEGKDAP